jgi:hypothetical protein
MCLAVSENRNKGQNECPNLRISWILSGTPPDTPGGHADTIWFRNQAMMVALSLQVVSTCVTCALLSSCQQLLIAMSRFQQVILPSSEL